MFQSPKVLWVTFLDLLLFVRFLDCLTLLPCPFVPDDPRLPLCLLVFIVWTKENFNCHSLPSCSSESSTFFTRHLYSHRVAQKLMFLYYTSKILFLVNFVVTKENCDHSTEINFIPWGCKLVFHSPFINHVPYSQGWNGSDHSDKFTILCNKWLLLPIVLVSSVSVTLVKCASKLLTGKFPK